MNNINIINNNNRKVFIYIVWWMQFIFMRIAIGCKLYCIPTFNLIALHIVCFKCLCTWHNKIIKQIYNKNENDFIPDIFLI